MFNLGAIASNVLNSMDSVAKETIEDIKIGGAIITDPIGGNIVNNNLSATQIRASKKNKNLNDVDLKDNENILSKSDYTSPTKQANIDPINKIASTPETISNKLSSADILNSLPSDIESLKNLVLKKDQEIENLNRECLELEEQCQSLKLEVQEAWDNYKISQEKAAFRETELIDEVKINQKLKLTDKQQYIQQLNKVNDDLSISIKNYQNLQLEKDNIQKLLDIANNNNNNWEEKLTLLQDELAIAKEGTVQGVQNLKEELYNNKKTIEQMRIDHSNLIKQIQVRQIELEKENTELVSTLSEKQKEIAQLRNNPEQESNNNNNTNEYVTMQQEAVEDLSDNLSTSEKRVHQLELEAKAAQLTADDEKRRLNVTINELCAQISELEEKIKNKKNKYNNNNSEESDTIFVEHSDIEKDDNMDNNKILKELSEHKIQNQNLSKLLLKKQSSLLELQTEKSALLSKLSDAQSRCTKLEQKIASMVDLEGDYEEDISVSSSNLYGMASSGLQQRRSAKPVVANKVINDLEKYGVKPSASVTKAVNMIDAWTLLTGKFLRSYPLIRLGFVFYLLVLHLWVLFILVIHMHSLESDTPVQPVNVLQP